MDIQVRDFNAAYNTCEDISKYINEMNSQIDALDSILKNVKTKWESTGQDKETYMLELTKQSENLTFISQQISTFVKQIKNYVRSVQETSKKTM